MKVKFTGISEENKIVKEKIMKSISSLIDKGDFILEIVPNFILPQVQSTQLQLNDLMH